MDGPQELEQIQPREVKIGEPFTPFTGKVLVKRDDKDTSIKSVSAQAVLGLPGGQKLKGIFEVRKVKFLESAIFPFDPERGYTLTKEDDKAETRKEKLEQDTKETESVFIFDLNFNQQDLLSAGIISLDKDGKVQAGPNVDHVRNLRLQILAGRVRAESQDMKYIATEHDWMTQDSQEFQVSRFYPLDMGPLPGKPLEGTGYLGDEHINLGEGHYLAFSGDDPKEFKEIEATFVIANDKSSGLPETT